MITRKPKRDKKIDRRYILGIAFFLMSSKIKAFEIPAILRAVGFDNKMLYLICLEEQFLLFCFKHYALTFLSTNLNIFFSKNCLYL